MLLRYKIQLDWIDFLSENLLFGIYMVSILALRKHTSDMSRRDSEGLTIEFWHSLQKNGWNNGKEKSLKSLTSISLPHVSIHSLITCTGKHSFLSSPAHKWLFVVLRHGLCEASLGSHVSRLLTLKAVSGDKQGWWVNATETCSWYMALQIYFALIYYLWSNRQWQYSKNVKVTYGMEMVNYFYANLKRWWVNHLYSRSSSLNMLFLMESTENKIFYTVQSGKDRKGRGWDREGTSIRDWNSGRLSAAS